MPNRAAPASTHTRLFTPTAKQARRLSVKRKKRTDEAKAVAPAASRLGWPRLSKRQNWQLSRKSVTFAHASRIKCRTTDRWPWILAANRLECRCKLAISNEKKNTTLRKQCAVTIILRTVKCPTSANFLSIARAILSQDSEEGMTASYSTPSAVSATEKQVLMPRLTSPHPSESDS